MNIKSIITALLLSTGLLFSSNEIYLDQIGGPAAKEASINTKLNL